MAQSDKVQIPVAHLTTVGRNLKNVKAELEAVENGMTSLSGVDDVHGCPLGVGQLESCVGGDLCFSGCLI